MRRGSRSPTPTLWNTASKGPSRLISSATSRVCAMLAMSPTATVSAPRNSRQCLLCSHLAPSVQNDLMSLIDEKLGCHFAEPICRSRDKDTRHIHSPKSCAQTIISALRAKRSKVPCTSNDSIDYRSLPEEGPRFLKFLALQPSPLTKTPVKYERFPAANVGGNLWTCYHQRRHYVTSFLVYLSRTLSVICCR
jgi:hypothetical protein